MQTRAGFFTLRSPDRCLEDRVHLKSRLSPPVKCRPTLQGADAGDTTTIVETAIAAAEQIEDAQADVTEPQTLDEIIADKGITAIRPWLTSTPSASARTRRARPGSTRLVTGARGPGTGVWESSPDSCTTRTASDAVARRIDRTLLRAPLYDTGGSISAR